MSVKNTRIIRLTGVSPSEYAAGLEEAASIIKNGGVVAIPTETVYGLGANALDERAVSEIFRVKGRPQDNPLIVHVASPEEIEKYAEAISPLAQKAIDRFMPGPFTAVLKKKKAVIPGSVTAGLDSIAIRCPGARIFSDLLRSCGLPIAAPSANLSGKPSPTEFRHAYDDLFGKADAIIDGGRAVYGLESTVVSFLSAPAQLLRPGFVSPEELGRALGKENIIYEIKKEESGRPLSPGMKYKHYAPDAPLFMVSGPAEAANRYIKSKLAGNPAGAVICFDEEAGFFSGFEHYLLGPRNDIRLQASNIFAVLRQTNASGRNALYIKTPLREEVGEALYNRVSKAAGGKQTDAGAGRPFTVGVIGGSGAGKSSISCAVAERLGFMHLDADRLVAEIYKNDSELAERINRSFSLPSCSEGVDRRALGRKVFGDAQKLELLNNIVHPFITYYLDKEILAGSAAGCVVDAAALVESGYSKSCDLVLSVTADRDIRIKRITERDGISAEEAACRIASQKSDDFYIKNSDLTIYNNGTPDELIPPMGEIIKEIKLCLRRYGDF